MTRAINTCLSIKCAFCAVQRCCVRPLRAGCMHFLLVCPVCDVHTLSLALGVFLLQQYLSDQIKEQSRQNEHRDTHTQQDAETQHTKRCELNEMKIVGVKPANKHCDVFFFFFVRCYSLLSHCYPRSNFFPFILAAMMMRLRYNCSHCIFCPFFSLPFHRLFILVWCDCWCAVLSWLVPGCCCDFWCMQITHRVIT